MAAVAPIAKPRPGWRSRAGSVLRVAVVSYLGIILVLLFLENWMVYEPHSPEMFWQNPPAGTEDVTLEIDGGTRLHAWWCPCPAAKGTLLYCHGNGGNLSHWAGTIQKLQNELGVSVLIFDYPGYGKSQGRPSEEGCYAAGEVAYRWLTETRKIPGESILLFGNSLGGGVGTYLAVRHPHRALILCKTFTSLPDVGHHRFPWLPVRWVMRNRFDSLSRIKECTKPIFVMHGTADFTIPYTQGQTLFAAANEPKEFFSVPDGDHDTPLTPESLAAMKAFLARTAP